MGTGENDAVEVRPRRQLLSSAWVTYLSLTAPLFAVLYWLGAAHNGWRVVLALHVALTGAFALAAASALRITVRIDGAHITTRGLFGGSRVVEAAAVTRILLVQLYQPGALETHPNLFLLGSDGQVLLRLRGQLWATADLEAVAAAIEAPVERMPQPLDPADLKRLHPGLLPWFER